MVKIYKFALFLYLNYIKEDWYTWTKFGRIIIYPFWLIRSSLVWLFCPIFIPRFMYEGSNLQKSVERMKKEIEQTQTNPIKNVK